MKKRLSKSQERRLLRYYLTNDFGPGSWRTIWALERAGMIEEWGGIMVVTAKGRAYCDKHRADMPIS